MPSSTQQDEKFDRALESMRLELQESKKAEQAERRRDPAAEPRTIPVGMKVSESEKARLDRWVDLAGLDHSTFLRMVLFEEDRPDKKVVQAVLADALEEVVALIERGREEIEDGCLPAEAFEKIKRAAIARKRRALEKL